MSDVGFWLGDPPSAVREAVEADARARDVSLNDAVGEILARRYGLEWDSSGYPFSGTTGEAKDWGLRMPVALRDVIKAHAKALEGGTMRGCILLALSAHYDLPAQSPRKRRPRRQSHGRPRGRKAGTK